MVNLSPFMGVGDEEALLKEDANMLIDSKIVHNSETFIGMNECHVLIHFFFIHGDCSAGPFLLLLTVY